MGRSIDGGAHEVAPPAVLIGQTQPDVDRLRVLVAEDDASNRSLFQSMLEILEVDVTIVGNGRQAVETYKSADFDLILMDCRMPEMDGLQATKLIRNLEHRLGRWDSPIPIMALTGNATESEREVCLAVGMTDVLAKPIQLSQLQEAIGRLR